jgi:hypothetical protein
MAFHRAQQVRHRFAGTMRAGEGGLSDQCMQLPILALCGIGREGGENLTKTFSGFFGFGAGHRVSDASPSLGRHRFGRILSRDTSSGQMTNHHPEILQVATKPATVPADD